MKWFISFFILFVLSIGVLTTESDESDEESDCLLEFRNVSRLQDACMEQIHGDRDESSYFEELSTTLTNYSGDVGQIHAVVQKYCPSLHKLVECTTIGDDMYVNCINAYGRRINKLESDMVIGGLDYVCANNGSAVVQILESNGFDTIYNNKKSGECYNYVNGVNKKIDETTLEVTTELCDGIDKAVECYINLVQDHSNQNLKTIANDFRVFIRQAIGCTSVNT